MCNPVLLLAAGTMAGWGVNKWQDRQKEKAERNAQARIDAIQKEAQEKIDYNKNIIQQAQSTQEAQQTQQQKQLTTQKVPLNTGSTGATVGSPTSIGLNLGGY
jgi:alpha-D-ribose 1-methylphosphonate 5-triphosphate synthase subunit PhnG